MSLQNILKPNNYFLQLEKIKFNGNSQSIIDKYYTTTFSGNTSGAIISPYTCIATRIGNMVNLSITFPRSTCVSDTSPVIISITDINIIPTEFYCFFIPSVNNTTINPSMLQFIFSELKLYSGLTNTSFFTINQQCGIGFSSQPYISITYHV